MGLRLWRPKNWADTVFPFLTINAIFGLGVFQYPVGRPRKLISVIYSIVLASSMWSLFSIYLLKHYDTQRLTQSHQDANYGFNFVGEGIVALIKVLWFRHTKKFFNIVDRLVKVDETLYKLGVTFSYQKCMFLGMINLSFWFLLVGSQAVTHAMWLVDPTPLTKAIIVAMLLKYNVLIGVILSVLFWFSAWCIGHRFYAINKLLEEPHKHKYQSFELDDYGTFLQTKFRLTSFDESMSRHWMDDENRTSLILIIKHVHLELTLITEDLNDAYGLIMLLQLGMDIIMFTGRAYLLCGILVREYVDKKSFLASVILTWVVTCILKLLLLSSISEGVTAESKRTGNLIHRFAQAGDDDPEFLEEIQQFGFQIYNVPVSFSPVGFFVLGYAFMGDFLVAVLTYLIIVIQMDSMDGF